MSVSIRLARIGKRNAPAYKVVVANTKDKRNGRAVDIVGHYNPLVKDALKLDLEKITDWKKKGALITSAVERLMGGTYTYTKYEPKKTKK